VLSSKNQNLLGLFLGQHLEETDYHRDQAQHEFPPVTPRVLEEIISGIFLESKFPVSDNTPGKVNSTKKQGKDDGEQRKQFYSSQLADAAGVDQRPDLTTLHKRKNPVKQSFCLLLLLIQSGNIHLSLSLLISLGIIADPMYHKAKGFSRKNYAISVS